MWPIFSPPFLLNSRPNWWHINLWHNDKWNVPVIQCLQDWLPHIIRERPFNTGGGCWWTFRWWNMFWDKGGVGWIFQTLKKEVIFLHTLMANILNKCHKKAVFTKNNWIWIYKISARWGDFCMCTRRGVIFACMQGWL